MRRMYQGDVELTPKRYMDLNRRFAAAFVKFRDQAGFVALVEEVHKYMNVAGALRVTDRQVAALRRMGLGPDFEFEKGHQDSDIGVGTSCRCQQLS